MERMGQRPVNTVMVTDELAHVRARGTVSLADDDQKISRLRDIATRHYPLLAAKGSARLIRELLVAVIESGSMAHYSEVERKALLVAFGASNTPTDRLSHGKREER